MEMPTMQCAGCGALKDMEDADFTDWWIEHGRCLRAKYDPPSEIDQRVRQIVTRTSEEKSS